MLDFAANEQPQRKTKKQKWEKIALIKLLINTIAALRQKEFEAISKQDLLGVASRNGFGHPTFYYRKILLFRKTSLIICIQDKKKKKLWGKLNIEITGTYVI